MSADFRVTDNFDFHLVVGLPLQAVVQIDDKSGFCAFGESVAPRLVAVISAFT